jgi:hypothetical protein
MIRGEWRFVAVANPDVVISGLFTLSPSWHVTDLDGLAYISEFVKEGIVLLRTMTEYSKLGTYYSLSPLVFPAGPIGTCAVRELTLEEYADFLDDLEHVNKSRVGLHNCITLNSRGSFVLSKSLRRSHKATKLFPELCCREL